MQKWFIIQENSHLGPYDEESLHQMFQTGQIDEETVVWNNKRKDGVKYKEVFLKEDSFEEIEIDLGLDQEEEKEKEEDDFIETVLPPEVPIDAQRQSVEVKEAPIKEKTLDFSHLDKKQTTIKKENKFFKKVILFITAIISLIIISLFFIYQKQSSLDPARPSGMKLSDFKRAVEEIKKEKNFFALSKDRKEVFLFSPYKGELLLGLKLDSIVKESLSEDPVSVTATAKLKNNIAVIKNFTYSKGDRIVEGKYQVEITTIESKDLPFPYSLLNEKKMINKKDETLLTSFSEEDFNKEKNRFWKSIRANEAVFWQDIVEQYQTLRAIITQIKESLENVFTLSSSLEEAVKRFEKNYKENFGMFFTSFVISNDKTTASLASQDFPDKTNVLGHYSHLSRLAKSVGSETMEILQDLETYHDYSNLNETDIKNKSINRLERLLDEAKSKEEIISSKYLE